MANIHREVDVCSQCRTAINDDRFLCVCCGVTMHLSKKCTGFADDPIKGIIQGGLNILLVCNQCVFTKRRDAMISRIPSQAQEGKIAKVIEEVNNFKSAVMEKLDLNDHDAMLTEVTEIRNEFTDFQTEWSRRKKPSTSEQSDTGNELVQETSKANQLYDGIRLRGVPESNAKTSHARLAHDMEHVKKILEHSDVKTTTSNIRRAGNFDESRKNPRPIKITVPNALAKRLILLSVVKMKSYATKKIYLSKELTPSELILERTSLSLRRRFLEKKVDAKDLRLRNLVLQRKIDDEWLEATKHMLESMTD